MQNISYFCIVKRIKYFFRSFFVLLSVLLPTTTFAQENDSIVVSLLTCGPGHEVYSLYGHTAIRYQNEGTNEDLAINYGMFSFDQDNFTLRFIFGQTDYEMGIIPFDFFKESYLQEGRWIKEQKLNLTKEEKAALAVALNRNYQPENRIYRYNFIYNNCTTQARDIIANQIQGCIEYPYDKTEEPTTYRELTTIYSQVAPWTQFGNDLLLGVKADLPISHEERQFLPIELFNDFETATILRPDGSRRKLVTATEIIISEEEAAAAYNTSSRKEILKPIVLLSVLAAVVLLTTAIEYRKKRIFRLFDILIMFMTGVGGGALFLMVFSAHPTVSLNLQILLFNPLNLLILYPVIRKRKSILPYWRFYCGCLILFLLGNLIQCYAEGTQILAFSLLIRYGIQQKRLHHSPIKV